VGRHDPIACGSLVGPGPPAAPIRYSTRRRLDAEAFVELYRSCSLGARRPLDDPQVVRGMMQGANLTVTAWEGRRLVGIARTLTDFTYVGYLADLAVRESHQRRGIGQALIERTRRKLGPRAMLVLLAAPDARDYYRHIGFAPADSAWIRRFDD
jgi:GNAT superfamily N-acetyltransferase